MINNEKQLATNIQLDPARQTLIHVIHDQFAHRDVADIRHALETQYGEQTWNSEQLLATFEVSHFDPPYVHVIRKSDGVTGTVAFNDNPRFYFAFKPDEVADESAAKQRV